ncbi:MotA/TolQ/ExbB proton channel family protein [Simkania negevensis]|uniref:MotA/TolQ/ExbB proton channel family protein n=1 Tax=Simkania negevensis TaxID=83561 RepID=A0ABS3ASF1_9BACT|nr:MotA/TolQ/ExbB proton channel family protein [Simkania negevensis]
MAPMPLILASHPLFESYAKSDAMGRLILLFLYALSVVSWVLIIYKVKQVHQERKLARDFQALFSNKRFSPLSLELPQNKSGHFPNSFLQIYTVLKQQTLEILNKNKRHLENEGFNDNDPIYLSPADITLVEAHLHTTISSRITHLEKNLFILSTVVSLAPFLGLLGTVWGILITFGGLQNQSMGGSQMMLGGLSMALATTVIGLIIAIPSLIAYNYLKSFIRTFHTEMEDFSTLMLASIEMQYRKVNVV